jgi:hypothetical protein
MYSLKPCGIRQIRGIDFQSACMSHRVVAVPCSPVAPCHISLADTLGTLQHSCLHANLTLVLGIVCMFVWGSVLWHVVGGYLQHSGALVDQQVQAVALGVVEECGVVSLANGREHGSVKPQH